MTAQPLTALLDDLDRIAHDASINEENYRKEAAVRFRELEQDRAFGFRRLNLMRTVTAALDGSESEEDAILRGSTAFLRELEWSGTSETQQETLTNFAPVIAACWQATQPNTSEAEAPVDSTTIPHHRPPFHFGNVKSKSGTKATSLPVSFDFRISSQRLPR
jgi:hypothetical protein